MQVLKAIVDLIREAIHDDRVAMRLGFLLLCLAAAAAEFSVLAQILTPA
jgi:hypothetical protein